MQNDEFLTELLQVRRYSSCRTLSCPYEVPKGLALCAIHHKAFGRGSIDLDENMRAVVFDEVNVDDGRITMLSSTLLTLGTLIPLPRIIAGHP